MEHEFSLHKKQYFMDDIEVGKREGSKTVPWFSRLSTRLTFQGILYKLL